MVPGEPAAGLRGPAPNFSQDGLPEWLGSWTKDVANLQSLVCDYVETAVARYAGQIRKWEVCACGNTGGALGLSEEDRLGLVARALDVVRQVDDEIQVMVQIDQPWGGYQARGMHRLSPLQFVDALLRSGIGLSAVNLELAVGFRPRGSAPRDLLELSRMLDGWALLGIPLSVTLAAPSESRAVDPQASPTIQAESDGWNEPWGETAQADWIDAVLPVLMAKQSVVGIFWTHFPTARRTSIRTRASSDPTARPSRPSNGWRPSAAGLPGPREISPLPTLEPSAGRRVERASFCYHQRGRPDCQKPFVGERLPRHAGPFVRSFRILAFEEKQPMEIDVYAPCPCGSGKKLKFCCAPIVDEMSKVARLQAGDQPRQALSLVEKLAKSNPTNPWVATTEAELLIGLHEPRQAKEGLERLLKESIDYPPAFAVLAMATLFSDGYAAARPAIHRALQKCLTRFPQNVAMLVVAIAAHMQEEQHEMSARQYLSLAMRLFADEAREEIFVMLLKMDGDPEVPYPLRNVHQLVPYSSSGPHATDASKANALVTIGCWGPAARAFARVAEQEPQNAGLWQNVALCRGLGRRRNQGPRRPFIGRPNCRSDARVRRRM